MTEERKQTGITRRDLLKTVGVLAGASAAGSTLAACGPLGARPTASGPLRIGVLLPFSDIYAVVGESITEAMRMYFESVGNEAGGRTIELIQEDTEIQPDVGAQKARKLVEQDEVDLVVGPVSSGVAHGIRDYFHQNQKLLIIPNAGSNALSRDLRSPYIFRTSFTNWQHSWPLGGWAYENVAQKVFVTVPDYAAGRQFVSGFLNNFQAHGGELVAEPQYTPFPNMGDPAPFIAEIQQADPPMVFCFYAGGAASTFMQAYHEFGLSDQIPLVAIGNTVGEDLLPSLGEAAMGVHSSLHWALLLDNPQNQAFTEAYRERTGNDANVYAQQGYDTAQVIVEAVNPVEGDTSNLDQLLEALKGVQFAGVRGEFKFDPATNTVINPIYVREVQDVDGALHNVVVENLGTFADPGDDSKG